LLTESEFDRSGVELEAIFDLSCPKIFSCFQC